MDGQVGRPDDPGMAEPLGGEPARLDEPVEALAGDAQAAGCLGEGEEIAHSSLPQPVHGGCSPERRLNRVRSPSY